MKLGVGMGLALVACGVVEAADPPGRPAPAAAAATAPTPAATSTPAAEKPAKPLDLRIGNVRKYMMPNEYRAALQAPEPDADAVVVEGRRVLVPMAAVEDVPLGLGSLWYAAKDPKNAWRLFAPVVNAPDTRLPLDKIPPPVFRWGP
jgi:hypothetical protein